MAKYANIVVSNGAHFALISSDSGQKIKVESGGELVNGGGQVNLTTVRSGGKFFQNNGFSLNALVEAGGFFGLSGGSASRATVYGSMNLNGSNKVLFSFRDVIMAGGLQTVSEAVVVSTTISRGGTQTLFSGGIANGTVVRGVQVVSSSGYAEAATVAAGGTQTVFASGRTTQTILQKGGVQEVLADCNGAIATTVSAGGTQTIFAGGGATGTILLKSGVLNIQPGGMVADTQLRQGAILNATNGASARAAVVSKGATLNVSGGGSAAEAMISQGATLNVHSSGVAIYTRIYSGGTGFVYSNASFESGYVYGHLILSGGTAESASVGSDGVAGQLTVLAGGKTGGTMVFHGELQIGSNGLASNTVLYTRNARETVYANGISLNASMYGGVQNIISGGAASGATISGGVQNIYAGKGNHANIYSGGVQNIYAGEVNVANIYSGGIQNIYGGEAHSNVIRSGGVQNIYDGEAYGDRILSNGIQQIRLGGTASGATVSGGGSQLVFAGGTAVSAVLSGENAMQFIFIGGRAEHTTVGSGGSQNVHGGQALSTTVLSDGMQKVEDGGMAVAAHISSGGIQKGGNGLLSASLVEAGGSQAVSALTLAVDTLLYGTQALKGGSALRTTAFAGGRQEVKEESFAVSTLLSGGIQHLEGVSSGRIHEAKALRTTAFAGGSQIVDYLGVASETTVLSSGRQHIFSGGVVLDTLLSGIDARQHVSSAGSAVRTVIADGGQQTVSHSGSVRDTVVFYGGSQIIQNGGVTVSALVASSGTQTVIAGGKTSDTTVLSGGTQIVSSAGVISAGVIRSGGVLSVFSGTMLYGNLVLGGTMVTSGRVSFYDSGTITFDLTERTGEETAAMIDNFSNAINASAFSITVKNSQATGGYLLMGNTVNNQWNTLFSSGKTITVRNEYGETLGAFEKTNSNFQYRGRTYTLNYDAYKLVLTVDAGERYTAKFTGIAIGAESLKWASESFELAIGGYYSVAMAVPTAFNANIALVDAKGKKVATGTAKNGILTFKEKLLAAGSYTLLVESSDKGKTAGETSFMVAGVTFSRGDQDDDWTDLKTEGGASKELFRLGTVSAFDRGGALVADNWVGFGDAWDYYEFTLDTAASLKLTFTADGSAQLYLYELAQNTKNGTSSLKAVKSVSVAGKTLTKDLAALLKEGTYYLGVKSPDAARGNAGAGYSITVHGDSTFFAADDGNGSRETAANLDVPSGARRGELFFEGRVGFGDEWDYFKFSLESGANLTLSLEADGKAQLYLYRIDEKSGTLKAVKNVSVTANQTKELTALLKEGTYYLGVKSPDAARGADTAYAVSIGANSLFYTDPGLEPDDNWTALKTGGGEALDEHYTTGLGSYNDWVGFGDTVDYRRLDLGEGGYRATFVASDNAKLTVYQLIENKNGTWSLKAVKSVAVSGKKLNALQTLDFALAAGNDYYLGVESTNAAKGGNASYAVGIGLA